MDFLAAGLSSIISIFMLALFVAGVMKLFQIHAVLTEIKEGLRSASPAGIPVVRRTPASTAEVPSALHEMASGDEMLRALDAQMKWDGSASRSETSELQQER